jgi:hypothetical protein
VNFRSRSDSPQWPKLLGTAAASSLATLFVVRNFFPAEKKVRHSIRADYAVGDDTFVRTMGHLLGPPLVEREQNYTARKRRSDFPGNAERHPFGAAHNYI